MLSLTLKGLWKLVNIWESCEQEYSVLVFFDSQYGHNVHKHTHSFNGPLSGTTQVSWYQKGKTNLDFTEARDSKVSKVNGV